MKQPGCFGHITTFNTLPKVCDPCAYRAECESSVASRIELLQKLNKYPDIQALTPAREKRVEEPVVEDRLAAVTALTIGSAPRGVMTKKARAYHETLSRKGIDLKGALIGRFNPIASTPQFLRLAFGFVLSGGYSKRELKRHFKAELDWGEATAASHVGIVTSLFSALGLVTVDKDQVSTNSIDK